MDLRQFLQQLDTEHGLRRVAVPVDPDLEVAALCRREFARAEAGQALHFIQVKGSPFTLAANLFGCEARVSAMLRAESLAAFTARIKDFLGSKVGTSAARLNVAAAQPLVAQGRWVTQPQIDLSLLPAVRSWPGESGRYLTLALAISQHPQSGEKNLGLYRAQILGPDRLAVNFARGSGAAEHLAVAEQLGQPLPLCLMVGGDPALLWAAAAPLPKGCDEFALCEQLLGVESVMTPCISQPLVAPANSEFIIEGQILPGQGCMEGPFGNHSGRYVSRADCPLMQVTAIRHREQAIMPITVVGPPPSENIYLAQANLCLVREMLKIDYPQITDLQLPRETIFHGATLLNVQPGSSAQQKGLIDQLWKTSPLSRAKLLVLLDADICLRNYSQCWWRTINQLDNELVYQDAGRIAIDATGIDPAQLVVEDRRTTDLLCRRAADYTL